MLTQLVDSKLLRKEVTHIRENSTAVRLAPFKFEVATAEVRSFSSERNVTTGQINVSKKTCNKRFNRRIPGEPLTRGRPKVKTIIFTPKAAKATANRINHK